MLTHFAEVHLQTLSPIGVRQVYHECLGFDILSETEDDVRIAITPHTTFHFTRSTEPVRPAHLAFEVRHSTFGETHSLIQHAHVPLDGDIESESTHQRYFKDGDGNLLEVYSHDYVDESVIEPANPMGVLYLREAGFVVEDLEGFYDFLVDVFGVVHRKGDREGEFSIVAVGTAHFVLNHTSRRWIPVNSTALKPQMRVTLGASSADDLKSLIERPDVFQSPDGSLFLQREDYLLNVRHTPDFDSDIPQRLNLPHTR